MDRKNRLLTGIVIVALIGVGALFYGMFLSGPDLSQGEKSILVLAVDKGEQPGMGGVDMAFIVKLKDGSIKKYTPVYPGGMKHPTQEAPGNLQGKMLLHDSLWSDDTAQGMQYAKEIVEANTNFTPDAVVAVNTEAIDAIIVAAKLPTELSAADIVRENDELHGGTMSRGEAVLVLARSLSEAATNEGTRNAMIQVALNHYSTGNIVMEPSGSFMSLLATKGFDVLTG